MKKIVVFTVVCILSLPLWAAPSPQVDRLIPEEAELAVVVFSFPIDG